MRANPKAEARLWALLALVVALVLPLRAWAGCEKDTDCKGDRVCIHGSCEDHLSPPPPPPPSLPPPPPPPAPRIAGSFWTVGGVGYLIPTIVPAGGTSQGVAGAFGGLSFENVWLIPTFRSSIMDGGITISLGSDLALLNANGINLLNTAWLGTGFDIGITRFLQVGPRVAVGYSLLYGSSPDVGTSIAGILLVGARINFWFTRVVGLYFEPEAAMIFPGNLWLPRIAGGFCIRS